MAETFTYSPDDLIVGDMPVFSEPETIAAGQNLARGSVLGRVTASKKLILSLLAASDGSQTPVAILVAATDASGGDVSAPVYKAGHFDETKLVYGAGHTAETVKLAFGGKGIFLREPLAL